MFQTSESKGMDGSHAVFGGEHRGSHPVRVHTACKSTKFGAAVRCFNINDFEGIFWVRFVNYK